MENEVLRTDEEMKIGVIVPPVIAEQDKKAIADEISAATKRVLHEEDIERANEEIRRIQEQEMAENLAKGSKFTLVREKIGKVIKGGLNFIDKNKKTIVTASCIIGAISIGIISYSIGKNSNSSIEDNSTSITDESMEEETKDIEKEGITVSTPSTSAPTPQTTITTTTEIKEPVEKPAEATPSTTVNTTPNSVATEPTEIVVTKPASNTTSEPQEKTPVEKPVATKPVSTTKIETKPQTTTTTKIKEEKEPVIKVEPIKIEDFKDKKEQLKYDLEYAGITANDELIENAVREIHSDYIEHDGLGEITASKNAQVNSLLSSIGSVNCATFSAGYMGYIPRIEDGFYISSEVMPESCREFQEKLIQISEDYRYELNQTPIMIEDLTSEEYQQISDETMIELDKLNIQNDNEYQEKYAEIYNKKFTEIYNSKLEKKQKTHEENARKAYEKMYKEVMKLVNSKEYEKLTPTEKLVAFTNISGALISGMQEKHIDKFEEFQKGIESSVDEAREDLIVANRMNISQKEALDKIVENNKPQVQQEREDLQWIATDLEDLYESGKLLIK